MKTLYYNGSIYTMKAPLDTVEALIEENGRILQTGKVEVLRSQADREVDLKGQTLLPGLTDTHQHLIMIGKKLKSLALHEVSDLDDMKRLVSTYESTEKWNLILGYDENNFPDQYRPSHEELDALTDKPTLVTRVCQHAGVVNTRGLELLGLDRTVTDPEGGYYERDENGELTGWVYDKAFEAIRDATVEDDVDSLSGDIETAVDHLYTYGITNAHTEDMSYHGPYQMPLEAYKKTLGPDRKKFRVNLLRHERVYDEMVEDAPEFIEDWIEKDAMKLFMDGAFGGRTALVNAPYEGTEDHGLQIHSKEALESLVKKARANNDAIAVHVIGDKASDLVVDAIEKFPVPEGKHDRLIHCSLLDASLIERMSRLNVICDIQPTFLTSDMPWVESYLGTERLEYLYAFRTMQAHGLLLGGSSDAPIEAVNPLLGIHALVTRRGKTGVYNEKEAVSRYDAFRMYTHNAAKIVYKADRAGLIEPGYYADFAIFDRDVMTVEADELLETRVEKTIVDGTIVYDAHN
ncbi:amidohydrolase [Salinicoccus sp. ID82-1]|uniref:amidohydrolase n=1 Tax=Salinicoccus sp. ID82-1 TaxID=2820269 RepID=UPI001F429568|nr:amidohydrolase [Salinicoccus sp. ID82-1]